MHLSKKSQGTISLNQTLSVSEWFRAITEITTHSHFIFRLFKLKPSIIVIYILWDKFKLLYLIWEHEI